MKNTYTNEPSRSAAPAETLNRPGIEILRYGLVLVVGWIGLTKFTGYEAKGIEPLVTHSPFMSWMFSFLSVQTFSNLLGVVEVTIASLGGFPALSAFLPDTRIP